MKHIELDSQDEAVKQFFLSLPLDANGSVLVWKGRGIVHLVPVAETADGGPVKVAEWTDEKNARRCDLIDKEIEGTLSFDETMELHRLQLEMRQHRRLVAPLPLVEARKLHKQLLALAQKQKVGHRS